MKRWWMRAGESGASSTAGVRPLRDRFGWWLEAALWLLLALQIARLFWAILTPTGPLGDWRGRQPAVPPPAAREALFASMDPFFRDQSGSPAANAGSGQVTSLALQLFGIRLNEGSGQGSAIIQTPDGVQASFDVGEELLPGVRLKSVAFDHVVIDRGGAAESLYLDQSSPVPPAQEPAARAGSTDTAPAAPVASVAPATGATPSNGALVASRLLAGTSFMPRQSGGAVTGIVVAPKGQGDDLQRAGLRPGDIITQVNGQPVRSAADVQSLAASVKPGARLSLMVERGSETVPIALILENKP
jgi:general secretion pathway protein C